MAKQKYSEFADALDAAATLDGTEPVVIIQDGLPVQTTTQDIADLGGAERLHIWFTRRCFRSPEQMIPLLRCLRTRSAERWFGRETLRAIFPLRLSEPSPPTKQLFYPQ